MPSTRLPAYRADQALTKDSWITSTAAAQGLGVSLPVFNDHYRSHLTEIAPTANRGVRFHSREVREMRDSLDRVGAELLFAQQPAPKLSGWLVAIGLGTAAWAALVGAGYLIVRLVQR